MNYCRLGGGRDQLSEYTGVMINSSLLHIAFTSLPLGQINFVE